MTSLRALAGLVSGSGMSPVVRPGRLLIVTVFLLSAVYAALLALLAHGAESSWGAWAVGAYAAAALVGWWAWRRAPALALLLPLAGALVAPATILPENWGQTSEVRVVARAARLWLAHGTPYLASGQLVSWRSYDPYLPGMSLFGLPHALGLPGALGNPLLWLAVVTVAALTAACRLVSPGTSSLGRDRRRALLRSLLIVASAVLALPMALGETDPPVIALICLGLALAARRPQVRASTSSLTAVEVVFARYPSLVAGVAIGAACALKATAWPAFPVLLAFLVVRDGRWAAVRFGVGALGTVAAVVAATAPALLAHPSSLWQNLVAYPLGLSHSQTQAASPLPGHLLASAGTLGHLAAIALLGGAALVIGLSLVLRPPRDVRQTTLRLAVGLLALVLLAPDPRFGYFTYPLALVLWLAVTPGEPAAALPRDPSALVTATSASS